MKFAALVQGGILPLTMPDASHRVTLYSRSGQKKRDIPLPTLASVMGA